MIPLKLSLVSSANFISPELNIFISSDHGNSYFYSKKFMLYAFTCAECNHTQNVQKYELTICNALNLCALIQRDIGPTPVERVSKYI